MAKACWAEYPGQTFATLFRLLRVEGPHLSHPPLTWLKSTHLCSFLHASLLCGSIYGCFLDAAACSMLLAMCRGVLPVHGNGSCAMRSTEPTLSVIDGGRPKSERLTQPEIFGCLLLPGKGRSSSELVCKFAADVVSAVGYSSGSPSQHPNDLNPKLGPNSPSKDVRRWSVIK
ncbi:uncharacterized protein EI97DRAFT_39746 [Westerdykella ornata]|uniref:Uncharacterized protein n=1 Tax=Westerdykella ornata TaxID=318751 RepID=A0A6A6JJJ3_WESOR|nr:uncharacterized protein EI97DRAFT_39746 [Westerdykella ornata]KAF2276434.1 hypothetical protein EI97DRAFT_39746 [Westerdykella ornata]